MVLELALGCVKRVADGDINVFVGLPVAGVVAHGNLSLRHAEQDPYLVGVALAMMLMRGLNRDPATGQAIVQLFEMLDLFAHARLNGI